MNIVFFDVHDYEKEFLNNNIPKGVSALFSACTTEALPEYKDADAISVFALKTLNNEVLSKFKNLKYIFTRSVGFSHIDKKYCKERGIKILNTPHYGDYTVAEFTFGILLSVVRKINHATKALASGDVNLGNFTGMELYSKTMGIIGLGGIGRAVEKIARGFSMNIICSDTHHKESYSNVSLDELCEKADIITLHVPLREENYHLLDESKFKKMKKGVVILNTARGELIDTKALIAAIESKKVAYAALDVVECEHILTSHNSENFCLDLVQENCLKKFMLNRKLLSFENVLITPHVAYDSEEGIERILNITIENIIGVLHGNFKNMV